MKKQIYRILKEHDVLHKTKHGFLEVRLCLLNPLSFLDDVAASRNEGKLTQMCYLSFNNTFSLMNQ